MSTKEERESDFFNCDLLADDFFIEIVSEKLKISREKFKVRLVLISPATGKNENYISVVYRAKINVELVETKERKFVDVILKVMLSNLVELEEFSVFPREKLLYDDIIPKLESIWSAAGREVEFGPKCWKIVEKPYQIMVLDDLKAEGFQMVDRKVGLDVNQAKLVLSKLAEFHAASVILYQQEGEISEHLDRARGIEPFISTEGSYYSGYIKSLEQFKNVVRDIEGFEREFKIIDQWRPEVMIRSFVLPKDPMKCGFQVLNHGDDWINNMMFAIDENGRTTKAKLIDFQIASWGSPAGDLFYFLLTSVHDDYKTAYFDEFIEFYHTQLSENLKQLKFDGHIPTLLELHFELIDKRQYAASLMMDILIAVKYDSQVEFTLEQMMDPEAMDQPTFDRVFRNDCYTKAIKSLIPFLYKRGLLDPVGELKH